MKQSEFGKGLAYCLGLFLAHAEGKDLSAHLWFNVASDHLYDLQIPETLPVSLAGSLRTFSAKVLCWGHGFRNEAKATEKDKTWAIDRAKELLRKVDMAYGVETQKAQWD